MQPLPGNSLQIIIPGHSLQSTPSLSIGPLPEYPSRLSLHGTASSAPPPGGGDAPGTTLGTLHSGSPPYGCSKGTLNGIPSREPPPSDSIQGNSFIGPLRETASRVPPSADNIHRNTPGYTSVASTPRNPLPVNPLHGNPASEPPHWNTLHGTPSRIHPPGDPTRRRPPNEHSRVPLQGKPSGIPSMEPHPLNPPTDPLKWTDRPFMRRSACGGRFPVGALVSLIGSPAAAFALLSFRPS